jgi:hypothetical protein
MLNVLLPKAYTVAMSRASFLSAKRLRVKKRMATESAVITDAETFSRSPTSRELGETPASAETA